MKSMIRSGGLCRAISLTVITAAGLIALVISSQVRAPCSVSGYTIESALGWYNSTTPYVLDDTGWGGAGTQVCIWPENGGHNQLWEIDSASFNADEDMYMYALQPYTGEDLCLDNRWNQGDYGNPVQMYTCNGTLAQEWNFKQNYGVNGDECQIVPVNYPWMALDVPASENYPGNRLWIWGQNGTNAQNWHLLEKWIVTAP